MIDVGVLDALRKRERDFTNPFIVQGLATSLLADPLQEDYPHAIYTLSELNDKEIASLSMLLAIESILQSQIGKATVISAFVDNLVLLKRSRKRRGEKAIISLFRKTGIQTPITLQPVKKILSGGDKNG